mgnify:CR=1 FL=1
MENDLVLFSPVGTTDPITNCRDGALLHICRAYRPREVWLYLSDEMLRYHQSDDRYLTCLNRLGEETGWSFRTRIIQRPGLIEVQRFDTFYQDFGELLRELRGEHPTGEILLNVSSGTPAMKSALNFLAGLSEGRMTPIQVSSPLRRSNPKREALRDFVAEDYWLCNEDNRPDFENRCEISETARLMEQVRIRAVCSHVRSMDYHAAQRLAEGCPSVPETVRQMLQAACARVQLDLDTVTRLEAAGGFSFLRVRQRDLRELVEYLLWLEMKEQRAEYADFIRGITPVIVDLLELHLKRVEKIDILRYCDLRRRKGAAGHTLTRKGLSQTPEGERLLEILDRNWVNSGGFKDTIYTSVQLAVILEELAGPEDAALIHTLREVESKVRNFAAHEIISVTGETLMRRCGHSAEEIMEMLWQLCRAAGCRLPKETRESYRQMNQEICRRLIPGEDPTPRP